MARDAARSSQTSDGSYAYYLDEHHIPQNDLPSPAHADATLKSSKYGVDTPSQGSLEQTGLGSKARSSSPSPSDKREQSNTNSNTDLEKQESSSSKKGEDQSDDHDPNIVVFGGEDDMGNPQNWPYWKKWCITVSLGLMTLSVTFASSVFSTATTVTSQQFGVSTEVMTLGTSLFVLGFAFGPLIWGPMSELYGRKLPLFAGFVIFAIFNIPVAVAQNLQTIFICRFLGGVGGSAPLAVSGGALADLWDPVNRGIAIAVFAASTFIGPSLSPVIGGFITMSYLGWRWTQWITLIMAALFGSIGFFVIPESYAPVLLAQRAKKLRYETKNWALHAKSEEQPVGLKVIVDKYLLRPFKMMFLEPILVVVTLYMSVIYGILYLFFSAFPIAFQEYRGWNAGVGALPFLGLIVGVACGAGLITYTSKTQFKDALEREGHVVPEARLVPMMVGAFVFPAGLFWFGWTSDPDITWVPQVISCAFIGMGVLLIFLQGLNYIVDVYTVNANSAIAANTFVRSFVGAGFPLFAVAMYHTLGVNWASSTLGFITAAFFPVPILFYYYGDKIRKMSRYVPQ